VGSREIDPPPMPPMVIAAYDRELRALLSIAAGENLIRLSAEARQLHRDFMRGLEPRLGPEGDLGMFTDWAGKLAGAVGRVASLLHFATVGPGGLNQRISAETMESALAIGRYLIAHAQAAFAEMGADPETEGAKRILAWLKRTGIPVFTKRDAHNALRSTFPKATELDGPLAALQDRGFIRRRPEPEQPGPGRKPSPIYEVHPLGAQSNPRQHSVYSAYSASRSPKNKRLPLGQGPQP